MRVGFIGLGLMGSGMTNNLQKAGHQLVVHDQRKEAADKLLKGGAEWAASPREVAEGSEIVFTSLPGPPEFEAVVGGKNGLLEGMQKGQPLFDLSTNSPTVIRRLQPLFAAKGAHLLDSPVSGGPGGAASGKMALWVSGEEEIYKRYRPVLDAMGDQIAYIGAIGSASVAKLVAQSRGLHGEHGTRRMLHHGHQGGRRAAAAVEGGAAGRQRPAAHLRYAGRAFPDRRLRSGKFALKLAHKDVSLATQVGKEMGVPMRLANLTLEEMTEALGRGWRRATRVPR